MHVQLQCKVQVCVHEHQWLENNIQQISQLKGRERKDKVHQSSQLVTVTVSDCRLKNKTTLHSPPYLCSPIQGLQDVTWCHWQSAIPLLIGPTFYVACCNTVLQSSSFGLLSLFLTDLGEKKNNCIRNTTLWAVNGIYKNQGPCAWKAGKLKADWP